VAAINAGGVTLHSLFQLPFTPFLPTGDSKSELLAKLKYNKQRQDLLRKMELLVIDEISMVRCDVIDSIDTILRSVRRRHDVPFGGVQLLCIGDLYQLPPVAQRQEWSILQGYYSSPFFFDSVVIKEQMPMLIELHKIYRQKEDSFVSLLNKVRNNQMGADDFENLHKRYLRDFRPSSEEKYITLTSHNKQADLINHRELQKLSSASFSYEAEIKGDFPESMYPAEGTLVLKQGAQVMFLKNDTEKRYFNGKIGVIKKLQQEEIIVDCDGEDIYVPQETWENSCYTLNRPGEKLEQQILGIFTQFPLRLAWAITIHKSQGLTFDKVMIDTGAAFSSGQVYVALSRCVSLDGIVLLSKIHASVIFSNEHVVKGEKALVPKGRLAEKFEVARQIFTQQLLEEIFSFNETNRLVHVLQLRIDDQKERLNSESSKWINDLKTLFTGDRKIGLKFLSHIGGFMKEKAMIEKNMALQKRINDAAEHFIPKFASLQEAVLNHPLVTEYREAANFVNEPLNQLLLATDLQNYYLQYCKQPFSVTSFLQHKLQYSLPRIKVSAYASGKKQNFSDIPNPELYDSLKSWRDKIVEETHVPIYIVANQNALKEIATYLPFCKNDLVKLSGFGKAKAEKYGDDIIGLVVDYCSQHEIECNMAAKEETPKRERKERSTETKTPTNLVSFNLFKEGKTIADIAKERNLSEATIEGHLIAFVAGKQINIDDLLPVEKQDLVKEAIIAHGKQSLSALKRNLPENISFGEIRLLLAAVDE